MRLDFKDFFQSGSKYYLLGIAIESNESQYQLMIVSYKNDELHIEARYFSKAFDAEFKSHFTKEYPVILYIEGEGVINKKAERITGYKSNLLFKTSLEDFYFYEYFQEDMVYVSIARKGYVKNLVEQLKGLNRTVIHMAFGPFVLANIFKVLKEYNKLSTFHHALSTANGTLVSFEKSINDETYHIGGDTFNQKELPLVAAFFDFKFPNDITISDTNFLNQIKSDYKYKIWLKPFVAISLIFLLTTVMISHFLLDFYLEKLAEKQSVFLFSTQDAEIVDHLKEEQKLKESILESSAIFNKEFIVKYVSDIGNSTPNEVTIQNIEFLPTAKKVRSNEKIQFVLRTILVEGEVIDDEVFNGWVNTLDGMTWVKKVGVEYNQEDRKTNSFKLKINF